MNSELRSNTKLAVLAAVRRRQLARGAAAGFTLIELMIVVAVIGILSAAAFPQYLRARSRAQAGAAVGELIGLAKECATGQASQLYEVVSFPFVVETCMGTTNYTGVLSQTWVPSAAGVRCLTDTAIDGDTQASVDIGFNGQLTCAFQ